MPYRSQPCIPTPRATIAVLGLILLLSAPAVQAAFVHPGLLNSAEEIAVVRAKVAAQAEPWKSALDFMLNRPEGSLYYAPVPYARPFQGSYGQGDSGGWRMMMDARAAYLHALAWVITDDVPRKQKAIDLLNAWSYKLEGVDGVNAKLIAAAAITGFANAAELLKYTDSGWSAVDQAQAASMFRNVYYPLIRDFQPGYNGNWDAMITHAIMAMGVFLDDQAMFDSARAYFESGSGNGSLPNYIRPDGTTQETTRDAEHENMGIAGFTGTCETAWHQGIDLYSYLDNRLLAGAEGVAQRVSDTFTTPVPCWETIYNHYHNRLGLAMPQTERVLNSWGYRPENFGLMQGIGYGTLTSFLKTVPISAATMGGIKGAFRP